MEIWFGNADFPRTAIKPNSKTNFQAILPKTLVKILGDGVLEALKIHKCNKVEEGVIGEGSLGRGP
jgi:hypothetical protein